MISGNLTPEDGAILPTKHLPWGKPAEKLREAEIGLLQMKAARDRVSFENGWTRFVDSVEEFWTNFYAEGIRSHNRFAGWISSRNRTKQNDELLKYVYQARHQSQHGGIALDWIPESGISVGQGFKGTFSNLVVFADGSYESDAQAAADSPRPFAVYFDPGRAMLPAVENKKFNQSFPPPRKHLDQDLGTISPTMAAQLTIQFYTDMLEAAKSEFSGPSSK